MPKAQTPPRVSSGLKLTQLLIISLVLLLSLTGLTTTTIPGGTGLILAQSSPAATVPSSFSPDFTTSDALISHRVTTSRTLTAPDTSLHWDWQNPLPTGTALTSVSCSSAQHCVAVGDKGLIIVYDGASWRAVSSPSQSLLTGVDCPSSDLCVTVGYANTLLVSPDGGVNWQTGVVSNLPNSSSSSSSNNSSSNLDLFALSCPALNFCVAVGSDTTILTSTNNGYNWTTVLSDTTSLPATLTANTNNPTPTTSPAGTVPPTVLTSVSCLPSHFCTAVGYPGGTNRSSILTSTNGSEWTGHDYDAQGLRSVSCVLEGGLCVAVGVFGQVYTTTTTTNYSNWFTATSLPNDYLYGVKCLSLTLCLTTGFNAYPYNQGYIAISHDGGRNWSDPAPSAIPYELRAVSCPTPSFCAAVGRNGEIMTSPDTLNWTPVFVSPNPNLNAISCLSFSYCVAVGDAGNILTSVNGSQYKSVVSLTNSTAFSGVSCSPQNLCVAVGNNGVIYTSTTFTGTPANEVSWNAYNTGTSDFWYGVSCTDDNLCAVVGSGGAVVATSDGFNWQRSNVGGNAYLRSVSCSSSSINSSPGKFCVALSERGSVYTSTTAVPGGSFGWSQATSLVSPYDPTSFRSISCTSRNLCVAVGSNTTIFVSTSIDQAKWSEVYSKSVYPAPTLNGVSCSELNFCMAVGDGGLILTSSDGVQWQTGSSPEYYSYRGVSCFGTKLCVIAGDHGEIAATYGRVYNSLDTGRGEFGTLSRALGGTGSEPGQTIVLAPRIGNTIRISGSLPPVPVGTTLLGQCGTSGPAITLDATGTPGPGSGPGVSLSLNGGTTLTGIRLVGFRGPGIVARSGGLSNTNTTSVRSNRVNCVKVMP